MLLENEGDLIPLSSQKLKFVVLIGERTVRVQNLGVDMVFQDFDNIGAQNGGWSVK